MKKVHVIHTQWPSSLVCCTYSVRTSNTNYIKIFSSWGDGVVKEGEVEVHGNKGGCMNEVSHTVINARSKLIITMMEDIQIYLMKKWTTNRKKINSCQGSLCPKIKNKKERLKRN